MCYDKLNFLFVGLLIIPAMGYAYSDSEFFPTKKLQNRYNTLYPTVVQYKNQYTIQELTYQRACKAYEHTREKQDYDQMVQELQKLVALQKDFNKNNTLPFEYPVPTHSPLPTNRAIDLYAYQLALFQLGKEIKTFNGTREIPGKHSSILRYLFKK